MPKVSIILPTYSPLPELDTYLERCLTQLIPSTTTDHELIIVENGSSTKCPLVQAADVLIRTPKPLGFSKAVNMGVKIALGEYFIVISNDVFVHHGFDQMLIEAYEKAQSIGVLCGTDVPQGSGFVFESNWFPLFCIRRDVWNKIGPMNEVEVNYRLGDQEYCMRAHELGYTVARWAPCLVQHINNATYRYQMTDQIEMSERSYMRQRWGYEHYVEWLAGRGTTFRRAINR